MGQYEYPTIGSVPAEYKDMTTFVPIDMFATTTNGGSEYQKQLAAYKEQLAKERAGRMIISETTYLDLSEDF